MKNPYYNPNYSNCWHGDEMFKGLQADVEDVLTALSSKMYQTEDGMTQQEWLEMLDGGDVKNRIIIWLAQNYHREGLEEPLNMLREEIKIYLDD